MKRTNFILRALCTLLVFIGLGTTAWGTSVEVISTLDLSETFPFSATTSKTAGAVTIAATQGTTNWPAFNYNATDGVDLRFYKGSTVTFSVPSSQKIESITFNKALDGTGEFTTANINTLNNNLSVNVGTFANGVWTAPTTATNSVTYTCGSSANVTKLIYSITVIYSAVSGGSQPTTYTITVNEVTGGTISADLTSAAANTEVTLTATPDDGYEFGSWSVKDASNNDITVSNNKFSMPAANVNVSATFNQTQQGGEAAGNVLTMSAADDADIKFVSGSNSADDAIWVNSTPLTKNGITLSGSVTSGTNYSYFDGSVVRFYTNNEIVISPAGAVISKIEIVRSTSTSSNGGVISCSGLTASISNTTTNTNVFTGNSSSAVTITASAQARFSIIKVHYTAKTIQSIAISGTPSKTIYAAGESFDLTGLSVMATLSDGSQAAITDGITWTINPAQIASTTTSVSVTAKYDTFTSAAKVINITVSVPTLKALVAKYGNETDGYTYYAVKTSSTTNKIIDAVEVTVADGKVYYPGNASDITWYIRATGENNTYTIRDANNKYLSSTSESSTELYLNDKYWTFTYDSENGYYTCTTKSSETVRGLVYNSSSTVNGFKLYSRSNAGSNEYSYFAKPMDIAEKVGEISISAAKYTTYYNSTNAFTMPAGCEGSVFTAANGLELAYEAGEVVPAGEPLVIYSQNTGTKVLYAATTDEETYKSGDMNDLDGTDVETAITNDDAYYFYGLSLNAAGETSSVGFYWMNDTGEAFTNGAHKAYLKLAKSLFNNNGNSAPRRYLFNQTDTATDVESVEAAEEVVKFFENGQLFIKKNGVVYNAMGQVIR